jgi:hypothetical protein
MAARHSRYMTQGQGPGAGSKGQRVKDQAGAKMVHYNWHPSKEQSALACTRNLWLNTP